jgi:aerobic carbon-monoxide dehydrogenase medium subunit
MNLQATRLDAQRNLRATPTNAAPPEFRELAVHRSRKRIVPFRLHIPHSVAEAVAMLCEYRPACIVAGGLDVINRLKAGDEYKDVVYIGKIDPLRHIGIAQDHLHVGAACTHHELAASETAARALPALAAVWGSIANPRIRFKGTVGGNLLAHHPDYEGSAILAALGGNLRFATPNGTHTIPCVEYFATRPHDPTWLVEAVEVPCNETIRLHYDRSLKGVAGVVVALFLDGETVLAGRASVNWAYATLCCRDLPLAAPAPLTSLPQQARAVARDWTAALPEPITNHLASGNYRRRIIEVHLRRALERAAQECQAG